LLRVNHPQFSGFKPNDNASLTYDVSLVSKSYVRNAAAPAEGKPRPMLKKAVNLNTVFEILRYLRLTEACILHYLMWLKLGSAIHLPLKIMCVK